MTEIKSLADLRPGDIMFGPIGGLVGLGVGLGQLALGESFRVGRLSIRHVGIVVEASRTLGPAIRENATGKYTELDRTAQQAYGMYGASSAFTHYPTGVITQPRLVQAMPGGAEEIGMMVDTHWTDRHAYVRLPEDYPGQAEDAAAIARLMVAEGVDYSFGSYAALAAWRWGIKTPRLKAWIGRRREPVKVSLPSGVGIPCGDGPGEWMGPRLPCEAICSVLADQSWTLAGKRDLVRGTKPQIVTPGMMAGQLWNRAGVVWGGPGLL